MAGFKDFNLPVTSKPVKTLSSSLDEDDWITDADPETASQADANQHKAPEQPSQPAPQKPARIPASTPFAVPAAQLPKNDVQPVRRYVTSLPSSQMPRPVPTAAAPKQAFGGSTEKLAKGRLASFENLSEQPRMASQETLRAQAAVKGRVAVEKSATTIDSVMLAARYPAFTAPEIAAFHQQFQSIDSDSKGIAKLIQSSSISQN